VLLAMKQLTCHRLPRALPARPIPQNARGCDVRSRKDDNCQAAGVAMQTAARRGRLHDSGRWDEPRLPSTIYRLERQQPAGNSLRLGLIVFNKIGVVHHRLGSADASATLQPVAATETPSPPDAKAKASDGAAQAGAEPLIRKLTLWGHACRSQAGLTAHGLTRLRVA
jgi:hypothetical protein